jgi:hypothetical protein
MTIQRAQGLGLLGILGSLGWLSLNTVFSPDWGPPGTSRYLGYETINRLWAPAFALVLCGYVGLYVRYPLREARAGHVGFRLVVGGMLLMIAGNIAEFWFLTQQGYGDLNARAFAWISVLLGWLVVGIGLLVIGVSGVRHRSLPRWPAWVFILAPPVWLVLLFTRVEWMGLPFVVTGVVAGALAAWPAAGRATQPEARQASSSKET